MALAERPPPMVGNVSLRWEEDDGWMLPPRASGKVSKQTHWPNQEGEREGALVGSSQARPGGWLPPPWLEPVLSLSMCRRRVEPLRVFRGLPGVCSLQPHPEATLRRVSVDVGFVLWKSSLGKREGEARGQALGAPSTSRNLGLGGRNSLGLTSDPNQSPQFHLETLNQKKRHSCFVSVLSLPLSHTLSLL